MTLEERKNKFIDMDLEKELKEVQIQYDKVCHERNKLKKENRLLKKDLKVLEILRKHSTRLDYENLNEEERKVIKEWLEERKGEEDERISKD